MGGLDRRCEVTNLRCALWLMIRREDLRWCQAVDVLKRGDEEVARW
jgi:hypothetical protein